jgi:hypothetical protein
MGNVLLEQPEKLRRIHPLPLLAQQVSGVGFPMPPSLVLPRGAARFSAAAESINQHGRGKMKIFAWIVPVAVLARIYR